MTERLDDATPHGPARRPAARPLGSARARAVGILALALHVAAGSVAARWVRWDDLRHDPPLRYDTGEPGGANYRALEIVPVRLAVHERPPRFTVVDSRRPFSLDATRSTLILDGFAQVIPRTDGVIHIDSTGSLRLATPLRENALHPWLLSLLQRVALPGARAPAPGEVFAALDRLVPPVQDAPRGR